MRQNEGSSGGGFHFGHNYVAGDQINQTGPHSIGKVESRQGSTTSNFVAGVDPRAIQELADFLAGLERSGLLVRDGEVVDVQALEESVVGNESRLKQVARAVASGAYDILIQAVNSAAAPAVLDVISRVLK